MSTEEDVQKQQLKQLKFIAGTYRLDRVMLRGCITGIFSAVGATIGFSIVLIVVANLIAGIKNWPVIDNILAETKLDVLIEKQINNLSGIQPQQAQVQQQQPGQQLKFSDKNIPMTLIPPQYLQYQASTKENDTDTSYHTVFEGTGPLYSLGVYLNENPIVESGSERKTFQVNVNGVDNEFIAQYPATKIDGIETNGPVFVYQTKFNSVDITIIGIASKDTPGVGREIFRQVLQNISFK